eukprot:2444195-Rhodomonas_salina.1
MDTCSSFTPSSSTLALAGSASGSGWPPGSPTRTGATGCASGQSGLLAASDPPLPARCSGKLEGDHARCSGSGEGCAGAGSDTRSAHHGRSAERKGAPGSEPADPPH